MTAALPLAVLVLALTALRPAHVSAHAELAQSDPPAQSSVTRAPAQVQLIFTEPVEQRTLEVRVLDRDRKPVDAGDAHVVPGTGDTVVASLGDLPPGLYTISWNVTSTVDGHTTRGLTPFSVGDAGAAPEPLSASDIGAATSGGSEIQQGPLGIAARWLLLLAMLTLGGLMVAGPLITRPLAYRLQVIGSERGDVQVAEGIPQAIAAQILERTSRLAWIALAAFVAGSLLLLLVDAAAAADSSLFGAIGGPVGDLLRTRRGVLWLVRSGLGIAVAAGLLALPMRRDGIERPLLWWGLAALVGGMLFATSLGSHSAALSSGANLATLIDWIHQLAIAVWIGGLIYLAGALLPSMRPLAGPARTRLLAFLVPRFSTIAGISVGFVIVTGLFQTWQLLDGLDAFRELEWGRALVVKLALVVLLLMLAAVNLLFIRPRLGRYAASMDRTSRERAASIRLTFRRVVMGEAALGIAVIAVVGVLTGVTPSDATVNTPDGPFRPFVLESRAENLNGRLVLSPGRIGNNRFDLTVQANDGKPLPADAEALLRVTTLDQETGTTEVRMQTLSPGRFTTAGPYLSTVGIWEVAAIIRRPLGDDVVLPFRLSLTEATGRPQVGEKKPAAPLARGRELFMQNCTQCHGTGGRGDGPLAASLRPPPLDLTVHVPLHSDQELENWLMNGIPRTAMPAFADKFSPEELQAVINFVRELARQSGQER